MIRLPLIGCALSGAALAVVTLPAGTFVSFVAALAVGVAVGAVVVLVLRGRL